MASKDESKIIADYQKLFAQIIGDYKCTICQGLGHSKRFHDLCPELRRQHKLAFNIISPPAAALPPSPAALPRPRSSPNLGLGPHAQSQSKPKSSWLDYISENEERWPKNHLQSLIYFTIFWYHTSSTVSYWYPFLEDNTVHVLLYRNVLLPHVQ
mgnify:CR=1 FL=1